MKDNGTKILALALLTVFMLCTFTVYAYTESTPSVSARAAALYEPETESFLYKKNFELRLPMASTTKIMTAMLALELLPLKQEIAVDDRAIGTDGSSIYLEHGEIMTAEDLVYSLMLASANDAAEALAYEIAGDIESFSTLMNERAEELGALDTNFENPHGLDAKGHYTTAHDLAVISAEALKNEKFREITSTYKKEVNSNFKSRLVVNHNKLLKRYEDSIGVKTGYTQLSGRSLVGAAERNGLTLISVTIDDPDDWNDHARLLDYGFATTHAEVLIEHGEYTATLPVLSGEKNECTLTNDGEVKIIYREKPNVKKSVEISRYLVAPVKSGDKVGKIIFYNDGTVLGECNIIVAEDVGIKEKKSFFDRIFN